jgi:hypothetical protein
MGYWKKEYFLSGNNKTGYVHTRKTTYLLSFIRVNISGFTVEAKEIHLSNNPIPSKLTQAKLKKTQIHGISS